MEIKHSMKWLYSQIVVAIIVSLLTIPVAIWWDTFTMATRESAEPLPPLLLALVPVFALMYFITRELAPNATRLLTERLVLDDSRIHIKWGVVTRRVKEIPYDWVLSVRVKQNFFERILGFGTLLVHTENDISGIYFDGVDNPEIIKQLIQDRANNMRVDAAKTEA